MRYIILYSLLVLINLPVIGQMPTNGNYCNWNWTDQSLDNWKRATPSGWSRINPPFLAETPANGELYKIQETYDYTEEKGWELVWAQFGPSDNVNPYFILYNKYRGILRAFFYLEGYEAYTHTAVSLSYSHFSNKPGVLTAGEEYSIAPDKYFANPNLGNNMITVIIPKHGRTSWGVADFPMFLDKNIKDALYRGATFEITFYGCGVYNAFIKGTSGTKDDDQNNQHTIIGNATMYNGAAQKFELSDTKLAKQIKSGSELQQYLNALSDKIQVTSSSPNFIKDYKKQVKEGWGNIVITALTSFVPKLKVPLKLFKTFAGALPDGSGNSTKSSGSTVQYINLDGTITINNVLGVNNIKIPGALANQGSKIAYYDYPLGLINLQKTPKIKVTKPYQRIPCNFYGSIRQDPFPVVSGYTGNYVKYKFDENIHLDRLNIPGMELLDVEYAIICKPNGTGNKKYKVEDKNIAVVRFSNLSGQTWTGNVKNPVYRDLEKGMLVLHDFGNETQYFGTPFLEKHQLKGATIEVPEDTEISIGVMALIKSPVSDIPVIVKTSFLPDIELVNHDMVYFACDNELQVFPFSDYYTGTIQIKLSNNPNSSTYYAGEIILEEGFVGVPDFSATGINVYPSNGYTVVNNVPYQAISDICSSNLKSNQLTMDNSKTNESVSETSLENLVQCMVYPNPNEGVFKIKLLGNKQATKLDIYNMNGTVVLSKMINYPLTKVDLTKYPSGTYFVRIYSKDAVVIKKVIINK